MDFLAIICRNLRQLTVSVSETDNRFAFPVEKGEIRTLFENQQNANTRKNTNWAYNVFSAWRKERGSDVPDITEMDLTVMEFCYLDL